MRGHPGRWRIAVVARRAGGALEAPAGALPGFQAAAPEGAVALAAGGTDREDLSTERLAVADALPPLSPPQRLIELARAVAPSQDAHPPARRASAAEGPARPDAAPGGRIAPRIGPAARGLVVP